MTITAGSVTADRIRYRDMTPIELRDLGVGLLDRAQAAEALIVAAKRAHRPITWYTECVDHPQPVEPEVDREANPDAWDTYAEADDAWSEAHFYVGEDGVPACEDTKDGERCAACTDLVQEVAGEDREGGPSVAWPCAVALALDPTLAAPGPVSHRDRGGPRLAERLDLVDQVDRARGVAVALEQQLDLLARFARYTATVIALNGAPGAAATFARGIENILDPEGGYIPLDAAEPRGTDLIAAERGRQVRREGYTAEHDAQHRHGQLLAGALAYAGAVHERGRIAREVAPALAAEMGWPWLPETFKPRGDLRDLVRAGALIAAEIDRVLAEEAEHQTDLTTDLAARTADALGPELDTAQLRGAVEIQL